MDKGLQKAAATETLRSRAVVVVVVVRDVTLSAWHLARPTAADTPTHVQGQQQPHLNNTQRTRAVRPRGDDLPP
ncbi:unnamed protein product [Heligmosomoides polygyrus]|uniref:Secreted protein n=1 Tax=Heligmosomoides polygyrus TaxID=6339 RepID=A0A183FFR6_HELPZ|nr:unnamed protein product [Heligmosomoides polygyrus]